MSKPTEDPKRGRMLDAARTVFARYGFKRASMADIAAEAGVSRPALYLLFRSKQDVLRSLAEAISAGAIRGATEAWREGATFAANLEATILGKEREIFPLLRSPHGAEILTADEALTAEIARDLDHAFRALLAARAADAAAAGEIDLACTDGNASAFADVVATAAKALTNAAVDETDFHASVHRFARVFAAAVRQAKM